MPWKTQETDNCVTDTDLDGVNDGVEYNKYEVPQYKRLPATLNWNTLADLVNDTDIDTDTLRPRT